MQHAYDFTAELHLKLKILDWEGLRIGEVISSCSYKNLVLLSVSPNYPHLLFIYQVPQLSHRINGFCDYFLEDKTDLSV